LFSFASGVLTAVLPAEDVAEPCQAEKRELFPSPRIVAAKTPLRRPAMDRMTFYAAGALMAWVLVGAAAIF
jgi:hypothetical protein